MSAKRDGGEKHETSRLEKRYGTYHTSDSSVIDCEISLYISKEVFDIQYAGASVEIM